MESPSQDPCSLGMPVCYGHQTLTLAKGRQRQTKNQLEGHSQLCYITVKLHCNYTILTINMLTLF